MVHPSRFPSAHLRQRRVRRSRNPRCPRPVHQPRRTQDLASWFPRSRDPGRRIVSKVFAPGSALWAWLRSWPPSRRSLHDARRKVCECCFSTAQPSASRRLGWSRCWGSPTNCSHSPGSQFASHRKSSVHFRFLVRAPCATLSATEPCRSDKSPSIYERNRLDPFEDEHSTQSWGGSTESPQGSFCSYSC